MHKIINKIKKAWLMRATDPSRGKPSNINVIYTSLKCTSVCNNVADNVDYLHSGIG